MPYIYEVLHVYSITYDQRLEESLYRHLLAKLPWAMHAKIQAFRRWEDAHAAVLGKLLLLVALRDLGYPGDLQQLSYTAESRPYLAGYPDFNLSHSGTRVVCVVGDGLGGRVGIDLEAKRPLDIHEFEGQFSAREWEMIRTASVPIEVFYHFWTAKEAVLKADGRGLDMPLSALIVEDKRVVRIGVKEWFIMPLMVYAGYTGHIAADSFFEVPIYHEPDLEELLRIIPT
jgi:4'-phosphopantetheinyl transferase